MKNNIATKIIDVTLNAELVNYLKNVVPSDEHYASIEQYRDYLLEQYDLADTLIKAWDAKRNMAFTPTHILPLLSDPTTDVEKLPRKRGRKPTAKTKAKAKRTKRIRLDDVNLSETKLVRTRKKTERTKYNKQSMNIVYQRNELKNIAAEYPMEFVTETITPEMQKEHKQWFSAMITAGSNYDGPLLNKRIFYKSPIEVMPSHKDNILDGIAKKVHPIEKIGAHIFNRYFGASIISSHISVCTLKTVLNRIEKTQNKK